MDVPLSQVVIAARHRLAPLTAEVAGYIAWRVALECAKTCRRVDLQQVWLSPLGEVSVSSASPGAPHDVELDVRLLLSTLLSLCQASTPALKRASERTASGELGALRAELETALIPMNHAASGRALARLQRETLRARSALVLPGDFEPPAHPEPAAVVANEAAPLPVAPHAVAGDVAGGSADVAGKAAGGSADVHAFSERDNPASVDADAHDEQPLAIEVEYANDVERDEHGDDVVEDWTPSWIAVMPRSRGEVSTPPRSVEMVETEPASEVSRVVERWPTTPAPGSGSPPSARASSAPQSGQRFGIGLPAGEYRSDIGQLLARFLADRSSDEHMTRELRRVLGLQLKAPRRAAGR